LGISNTNLDFFIYPAKLI